MSTTSMMSSAVLAAYASSRPDRIKFDPTRSADRLVYKTFVQTGKWVGGCPFKLEWPFLTVPGAVA